MKREYDVMGRTLEIHLGDITLLEVGAIVSSENSDLIMDLPGNPSVSSAIREVEGEELAAELARMGPIEPGRAVVTPARALRCKWVIHAASVIKGEDGHRSSITTIREAVRSSLRLAAGLGLDSVAFPAFGVRATAISREQASQAMVEELVAGLREQTSLRRVVIALLDPEAFLAFFEQAMKRGTQANTPIVLRTEKADGAIAFSFEGDGAIDRLYTAPLSSEGLTEIIDAVGRLRSAAERRLLDAPLELRALGTRLHALLPGEVWERLGAEPERPVVLRLDEALAALPFELAWDGDSYLVETRSVSRLLITRASGGSRRMRRPRERLEVLLIAGAADSLPASGREAEALSDLLWRRAQPRTRVTVLADRRATRTAVGSTLPQVDLLHWCGHTRAPAAWELAKGELLSADDIAALHLTAKLVFANSCGPDGGATLPRAFLLAGAQNYVGTLWEVDDALAQAFALKLYEDLLTGRSLGDALAAARAALRGEDPLHWAAYVHYGLPSERLFEPVPR